MKLKKYDEGGAYVTEQTAPMFVRIFLIVMLLFCCSILFSLINIAHPMLLFAMGVLVVSISILVWLSMAYKVLTYYRCGSVFVERITCYWGSPSKRLKIQISGYKEIMYGRGLITSGTVGGTSHYVVLANGNRECNFEVASVTSKNEAEEIADTVSQHLSLPKKQVSWNEDPTRPSNLKGHCEYIHRDA